MAVFIGIEARVRSPLVPLGGAGFCSDYTLLLSSLGGAAS